MPDIRRKGKVPTGPGQLKDAELIEIQKADEKWSTFDLDDGTTLKFRAVVSEIWRVIGEYDADGNPVYVIKSQNVFSVTPLETLKKRS